MCEAVLQEQPIALESVALKVCSKCHVAKPLTEFYKGKRDRLEGFCKDCKAVAGKANREKNKSREVVIVPEFKKCFGCKAEKPGSDFTKSNGQKSGLKSLCKECSSKAGKATRAKNKAREAVVIPEFKVCPGCETEKPSASFSKSNSSTDGLNGWCKECDSRATKALQVKNKVREVVVIPASKRCSGCRVEKFSIDFVKSDIRTDGLSAYCKECTANNVREIRYGITPEQYQAMLLAQGGACVICKFIPGLGDQRLDTDHIHGTDIVRGLLNRKCNRGLGLLKDNIDYITKAIEYLSGPTLGIPYKKWVPKAIRDKILSDQNYLCKICSTDLHNKKACVDHDHLTNMIRGILCHCCNLGLGQFDDSVVLLGNAVDYLKKAA